MFARFFGEPRLNLIDEPWRDYAVAGWYVPEASRFDRGADFVGSGYLVASP